MRPIRPFRYPEEQRRAVRRARRLEVVTIVYLVTAIVPLFLLLGQSQAMRAAWIDAMLSLLPPIGFLVSSRVADRDPNERFPFGFHRAATIAHLAAALTLFGLGVYLLWEAGTTFVRQEHPTIGSITLFGQVTWLGWPMLAALAWSGIPAVVLGRRKMPLAEALDNKVLHADADMNKADWSSAAAAAVGVIGVGFGLWWADAAAAVVIGADVLRDGIRNTSGAVADLMDQRPVTVSRGDHDPIIDQLREHFASLPWVAESELRLREEGELLLGEVFLTPHDPDAPGLIGRAEQAVREGSRLDWKIYELTAVLRSPGGRGES